ncbi:MAG: recombination mediator RecR [Planctomycetota bacterium]
MSEHTPSVTRLIDHIARMPGIGRKSAERLAFYILKLPKDEAMELAYAIRDVKKNIRHCAVCFNLAEEERCPVCRDARRDPSLLCVVAWPRDLAMVEETGTYRGLYHVLMGVISPVDEVLPADVRIAELVTRVRAGGVAEVIICTNPTAEGDFTAQYILRELAGLPVRVTRMARGVPAGSEIEFSAQGVIAEALAGRVAFTAGE